MKYRLPAYLLLIVGTVALLQGFFVSGLGMNKHLFATLSNPPVTDKQLEVVEKLARRAGRDAMTLAGLGLSVIVLAGISLSQMKEIQRAWDLPTGKPK